METSMRVHRASRARGPFAAAAALCLVTAIYSCETENENPVQPTATRGGIPGWLSPSKCFDADAAPVVFGASWPLTNANGSPNVNAPTLSQIHLVQFEINNGCGLRIGSKTKKGSPVAVEVRDIQGSAARAATVTEELIALGVDAVFGAGGSGSSTTAAQVAVAGQIPFGANQAAADGLSGCTAAELADPGVVKSATPIYEPGHCWDNGGLLVRTAITGYLLGTDGARYARETYPGLTTAAIVYRDDDFGQPNRDGVRDKFVELGGTVVGEGEGGFDVNNVTKDDFKQVLQQVTAANPSIILGSNNQNTIQLFAEAYAELRVEWTEQPANFSTLRFVWTSNLASGTYEGASPGALAALVDQSEFVTQSWDANSEPFHRWLALYQSYDPTADQPSSGFYMAAYDAAMVIALAMTAAGTTDGPAVAAKVQEVANPPGVVICPGQWRKAFRLLAKGKDIDFEGARGALNIDERGNATNVPPGLFRFEPDGSTTLVRTLASGPQIICGDDED